MHSIHMRMTQVLIVALFLGASMSHAQLVAPDATLKTLGTRMQFIEGPVWTDGDPDDESSGFADGGYLIFSDIPVSKLHRWDAKKGLTVFRERSNQTNGNTRDREDRLISCEHAARRVTRTETDGTMTVLADRFDGKRFNSPNDVVVKSDGSIWFTDPPYGLPKGEQKELDGHYVYRLDPDTKQVTKVADGFDMPNGLCFSPDEKKLYIADSGRPHNIRVFDVKDDGTLAGGGVYCIIDSGVPDGIRCDAHGNVWSSAGDGVHVFSPERKLIQKIPVPETPTNLCFGEVDGKTLFVTAQSTLFSIRTNVCGASRPKP